MADARDARIAKLETELAASLEREKRFGEIVAQQQTLIAAQQELLAELVAIVRSEWKLNPFGGHLFVFLGRHRLMSVVFPAPRNPVTTVTGVMPSNVSAVHERVGQRFVAAANSAANASSPRGSLPVISFTHGVTWLSQPRL